MFSEVQAAHLYLL